jgi:hypothetical protein
MDLLGGYGSDDDDNSEPLAMNGPAAPPPDDESSGESADVQHTLLARAPNVATSIAPLPRIAAAAPSASETATSSAAQNPLGAAVAAATPASSHIPAPAPPPKRKLPSAAALLSAVPTSHTYAGFKSASSTSAAAADERTDAIGTKYNTGAFRIRANHETDSKALTSTHRIPIFALCVCCHPISGTAVRAERD